MTSPWHWRPFRRVSELGRCVICNKRPADGMIRVQRGYTRATLGNAVYDDATPQPWCRPCGQAVLDFHGSENIWYSLTDGWLPKNRIPL